MLRRSPSGNQRHMRSGILENKVVGAELNVASGASLLGLETGITTKLPDNDLGKFARNSIRFSGVSDEYIVYEKGSQPELHWHWEKR